MLSEILHGVAGFEINEQAYYPRPSMSGPERCLRQTVYFATKVQRDKQMANRFVHVLDDSSWHEELTADWIGKTAFILNSRQMEVECYTLPFCNPPFNVKGKIDGILTDMFLANYLWEHKAINHFTFEKYWNGYEDNVFPLDYICQCSSYLKGLQKVDPDINKAVLLIKNKNTSQFFEYILQYDVQKDTAYVLAMCKSDGTAIRNIDDSPLFTYENVVSGAIERFRLIDEHIQNNTLPERQYDLSDWQCGYCGWKETCWQAYEKEYSELATDINLPLETISICEKYLSLNAELGNKTNPGLEAEKADLRRQILDVFNNANQMLQTELPELAAYYLEVCGHIERIDQEKENIKKEILSLLEQHRASKAYAGGYTIHNRLQKTNYLDREQIDPRIIQSATRQRITNVLTIRTPKNKDSKGDRR